MTVPRPALCRNSVTTAKLAVFILSDDAITCVMTVPCPALCRNSVTTAKLAVFILSDDAITCVMTVPCPALCRNSVTTAKLAVFILSDDAMSAHICWNWEPWILCITCWKTKHILTRKAPNTTIAEVANTVDPDEMAHLQCLPSSLLIFQHNAVYIEFFNFLQMKFCRLLIWRFTG